ncbi:hypothetical protein DS2_06126 [Catenovulum agarivorans DS-2]|uniref:Uncharacterized protein n=1 Tax=Catenovulum agarivorans DS-2 TaxID=1328313 RepID=W7QZQ1_9ALTE|nr:hypothetical protein [Catenovulum agarivorans]EWH10845.1 hypothetical protein DS2_06126 [Catenovulum agarivorans DS-2]
MKFIGFLFKLVIWLVILATIGVAVSVYLIRSDRPLITQKQHISAERVSQARQSLQQIAKELNNTVGPAYFQFHQSEVDAMMAVVSYTVPSTKVRAFLSKQGVNLVATTEIKTPYTTQYVNLHCMLLPSETRKNMLSLDYCDLGKIKLPKWMIEPAYVYVLQQLLDDGLADSVLSMVRAVKLADDSIGIDLFIQDGLKQQVLTAIQSKAKGGAINNLVGVSGVKAATVKIYLNEIQSLYQMNNPSNKAQSLAFYLGNVFYLASLRSEFEDAETENQAALWALVIAFGNRKFGHFLSLPRELLNQFGGDRLTLMNRGDLKLHFLFSAALERLVQANMGLKVGELKELMDMDKGGSGFSFADLAADKAGIKFAQFVLEQPELAQQRLTGNLAEAEFFPSIADLPEGLAEKAFNQSYGNTESAEYKQLEAIIDQRIAQLALYQ